MQQGNTEARKAQTAQAQAQVSPKAKKSGADRLLARAQAVTKKLAKEQGKAAKAAKESRVWALVEATTAGFLVRATSESHNDLEAQGAAVNKAAGSRVAFIVDSAFLPVSQVNEVEKAA